MPAYVAGEYDARKTLQELAHLYRAAMKDVQRVGLPDETPEVATLRQRANSVRPPVPLSSNESPWRRFLSSTSYKMQIKSIPNALGLMFCKPFVNEGGPASFSFMSRTRIEACRLRMALAAFKRQHGRYPSQLAELSTAFPTDKLPVDIYTGKAFSYDRSRNIFWSAGPNRTNDGGSNGTDLIFRF